jgi:phosphoribosylanthranilate isomerase
MHTRIKICGLTREADVAAACNAGADAVGFVCYPQSPRCVAPDRLRALASGVSPFTVPVLLFVNGTHQEIEAALRQVPHALLQFHGDEPESECARYGRPYLRAMRMEEGVDLLDCTRRFPSAAALLLDAPSDRYGGSGRTFDWARIPRQRAKPVVLAGGLDSGNVARAISAVQPYAVDVSSGVEDAPGVKSALRIRQFVEAVRSAELQPSNVAL